MTDKDHPIRKQLTNTNTCYACVPQFQGEQLLFRTSVLEQRTPQLMHPLQSYCAK